VVLEAPRTPSAPAVGAAVPIALSHPDGAEARRPVGTGSWTGSRRGLVAGSVVLLGGEPGIGKSTLLLQIAAGVARGAGEVPGGGVLYATGEESTRQVRLRAGRLGLAGGPVGDAIRVVAETEVGRIVELARGERPALLLVDSIQTVASDELVGPPGSVGQVREATLRLMELAKSDGIPVVLVGHVTKTGRWPAQDPRALVVVVLSVGATATGACASCEPPRTVRPPRGSGGCRDGRARAGRGGRPARRSWTVTLAGTVQRVAPILEGSRPLWSRCRPSSRRPPRRRRGARASGVDPNGWRSWSPSWAGGRGSARRPTMCTRTSRAA